MTFDGKAFGEEMVAVVKGYVARSTGPINDRLARLEEALRRQQTVIERLVAERPRD